MTTPSTRFSTLYGSDRCSGNAILSIHSGSCSSTGSGSQTPNCISNIAIGCANQASTDYAASIFGKKGTYMGVTTYSDSECRKETASVFVVANGSCIAASSWSFRASISPDGMGTYFQYNGSTNCTGNGVSVGPQKSISCSNNIQIVVVAGGIRISSSGSTARTNTQAFITLTFVLLALVLIQ